MSIRERWREQRFKDNVKPMLKSQEAYRFLKLGRGSNTSQAVPEMLFRC